MTRHVDRLIDVAGNRCAEGLRVLEDTARLLLDDAGNARCAKEIRHRLRAAVTMGVLGARDAAGDVGIGVQAAGEGERASLASVVRANAARVQESARSLEELAKLVRLPGLASAAAEARYAAYDLERDLLSRLPAWQLWRDRLFVLVDARLCRDPAQVAAAAARGGAGVVQLRAKALSPRAYLALAREVQAAARGAGALFCVNDHVAVAAAIEADLLHIGQDDLPVAEARRVVGPLTAIGVSAHSLEQARAAVAEGADYLGLGPMFATPTKPAEPARGPALLDAVAPWLRIPSYAIGGLDAARIGELGARIPHGVAVAGAVCRAPDPEAATAELRRALAAFPPAPSSASLPAGR